MISKTFPKEHTHIHCHGKTLYLNIYHKAQISGRDMPKAIMYEFNHQRMKRK